MKTKLFLKGCSVFVILIILITIQSCTKDAEPEVKDYQKILSLSIETQRAMFSLMAQPQLVSKVKYPVDVYSYKYSMPYKGTSIKASGLICVPVVEGKSFPVLSFQHGTIVAHSKAPTLDYNSLTSKAIESIAGLGYYLVIPDEIGFGESSGYFHPYLIKKHNVLVVTEMLKSVKNISDGELSGASLNDSLFLLGYSHGGWVTMATLKELETGISTDWDLIATASGAGPYFPEQVMDYALSGDTYDKPFYMSYVLMSFVEEGLITNSMSSFFKEPYATSIPALYDGTKTGAEIDAQLTKINADLYKDSFLNDYPNGFEDLQTAVNQNKTGAWLNKTPIMLTHGQNDVYIPVSVSDSLYQDFIELGSENIEYLVIPLTDHNSAVAPAIGSSLIWFNNFR